jgi:hypothetical protein
MILTGVPNGNSIPNINADITGLELALVPSSNDSALKNSKMVIKLFLVCSCQVQKYLIIHLSAHHGQILRQ